jgi:outer membrane protein assembly factor BamA
MTRRKICAWAARLFAFLAVFAAGSVRADQVPLVSLKFAGLAHFSDAQVTALSGLKIGAPIAADDLKAVANRLAQSGAFDNVSYKYDSNASGMRVEFDVVETRHVIPCVFENFIWFSDSELAQALHERAPLYGDVVPINGPTLDEISDSLRSLMKAKQLPGSVDRIPITDRTGKVAAMSFQVTGVSMPIRELSFPGATAGRDANLRKAASELIGRDFSASEISTFVSVSLVPFYRRQGYFRAHFNRAQATLKDTVSQTVFDVSVSVPVAEGAQYYWDGALWTGDDAITSGDLDQLLALKRKERADGDAIDAGLQAISQAYAVRGYLDATLHPKENLDDAKHLVSYDVAVTEGIQYHMGDVAFAGVSDSDAKRLAGEWQLRSGDIYNAAYLGDFEKTAAWPRPPAGKTKNATSVSLKRNPQTATVDVTFTVH